MIRDWIGALFVGFEPHARRLRAVVCAVIGSSALLALAGCGGGGGGSGGGAPLYSTNGTLSVQLTDSPACGYDHVYVTVDHVEISTDGTSWITIPVASTVTQPIDLLNLQNGALLTLGQAPLAAGTYQQVRLVLKSNGASAPYANAVVLTGSATQIPLTTPSGTQTGYKILGPITVQAGTLADLILDFNACKSIVPAGGSGKYLLKPVITAVAQVVSGAVSGSASPGATVYAEQQSSRGPVILVSAVTDAKTGAFTLSPILASSAGGNVDVVVVPAPPASGSAGFGVAIVQNVPVAAQATTSLGTITPLASTINGASGVVNVAGSPGAASLVANQTNTATNRTYEIASTSTTTGPYSFLLAAGGPWVGPYSTSLPIVFTQDTAPADAGIYSLIATDAAGTVSAPQTVNLSAGPATSINFSLTP